MSGRQPKPVPGEQSERSVGFERRVAIAEALDGLIERCRKARMPLERALDALLARACELLGARGALVRSLDEHLERRAFRSGAWSAPWDALVPERFESEPIPDAPLRPGGGAPATIVLRRLDCADEVVGVAGFAFDGALDPALERRAVEECRTAAEMLDNYLEAIASAAKKQRLSVGASSALRSSVLEEGADRAVELLSRSLGLEEVALVYVNSAARGRAGFHYRLYRQGAVVADSVDEPDARLEEAIARAGEHALDPRNHEIAGVLGRSGCVETALINGLLDAAPVGKLIVRNAGGSLDSEGMDVLNLFAECLSQRLVDYNRERRQLAKFFSPSTVTALVREPGYVAKYLNPKVEEVAILFADVAGFTAISERALDGAAEIGELIDLWAGEAVRIIHRRGGAFDKLVGDCAIGLFGPPFFRERPGARVASAVQAAIDIADMTRRIGAERGYDEKIRARGIGAGLGVSSGVNFGPTSVGLVGPNQDYTGFSSHMNNAARLQGLAKWNEVLVMDRAREAGAEAIAAAGIALSGPEEAKAKNVKDPLRYYRVERKSP